MAEAMVRRQPWGIETREALGAAGALSGGLWRRVAGFGLAVLLAGCQVVPKSAPPVAPPPPTTAIDQGPSTGLPEDQARHRIALLVPMTGPNAAVGISIANAANLAVLDTGGRKVRITTYDTGPGAAAAAQRALADGSRLFLGPLTAEEVRAVAAPARAAGVPVIAFSNDSSVAGNGVYTMGFSPNQSIERVVDFARSKGVTRFAGLMPSGLYGRNASSALIKAAEGAGGSVVAMQSYDRSPKSLGNAVTALGKDQGYDAVLIADSGRIAIQAAPLIRKGSSPDARILGTELWNTDAAVPGAPLLNGAWYATVSDGMYRQLAAKYRGRFGKAPYRLSSLGYDAVLLAVRIAGDWEIGQRFPAAKLTDGGGFAGVDGAFRFGRTGIAERALEVHQVGGGTTTTVAPAPRSFAE